MIKCCENCRNAVWDSVPWGMGSCSYLSGCKVEDELSEKVTEEEFDAIMDGIIECPCHKSYKED